VDFAVAVFFREEIVFFFFKKTPWEACPNISKYTNIKVAFRAEKGRSPRLSVAMKHTFPGGWLPGKHRYLTLVVVPGPLPLLAIRKAGTSQIDRNKRKHLRYSVVSKA
jgi:hypothetical protein